MKKTSIPNLSTLLINGQGWLFPVLAAWVSFVFIQFFFKLYSSWNSSSIIPNSLFSIEPVALSQRLSVWKESFLALAAGILVMGILWSCGKRLFRWLLLEAPQPGRFCLEIGLCVFSLNLFWMGLGLVRLWIEPLWLVGFISLTFLFLTDLLKMKRQGFSFVRPKGLHFWLSLLCAFYMGFLLLHSLLPETFYDSLNYFLGMPSFWLWHHGICDYPTHLLSGYFHGGSLFFLSGFVLVGTEGAKVLAALVLFWTALFGYGWAREIAGPKAGPIAFAAILTFPLLYLNSWAVRVDGLLTFILLLFFYAVEKGVSLKKGNARWIVAAGIFAGLALSIKPTAVVGIGAALIALLWRDGFGILKKKGWLVFSGIIVLEVGPWLLKNACFAGNAFFPYAISLMGGRTFPAWSQARLLHENQQFLPMDHGLLSILDLPWRFTIPGAGDDQFIGPILLAFLPLLLLLRFKSPSLKFLARTLLIAFVLGLTLSHMLRFSIPAFVLAFLVLSAAVMALKDVRWKLLWTGAAVASALLCVPQFLSLSADWYDGWGVWSGNESRQEYLSRKFHGSYMARWVAENLPKDSRLLIVGDSQVLYYKRQVCANSVFDEQFFTSAARYESDPEKILEKLKKLGMTHVIFDKLFGTMNSREYRQYELKANEWRKLWDFVQRGLEPLVIENSVSLYKVRERLEVKPLRIPNPFYIYPSQALDFVRDLSDKNYSKARLELNQLKAFFPGDDHWAKKENELIKAEKSK